MTTERVGRTSRVVVRYGVVVVLALLVLFPFVWMLSQSTKTLGDYMSRPPALIPDDPNMAENYERAWQALGLRPFMNSFVVAGGISILQVVTCSMAGFAFAKLSFRGRTTLFRMMVFSLMVPTTTLLIPLFLLVRWLGIYDSYLGLILPWVFSAFGVFLFRQFFLGVPNDLFESAYLEGASPFRIWWHVYRPLSRAAMATLGALSFVFHWNSLAWPTVATRSPDMQVLALRVASLVGQFQLRQAPTLMAAAAVAVLPPLVVFLLLQRYFVMAYARSGVD